MYKWLVVIPLLSLVISPVRAASYGQKLCQSAAYDCLKVKPGSTWNKLFPNPQQNLIVKKVNRMNTELHAGMVIAVPKKLDSMDLIEAAPFPHRISPRASNLIKVDLSELAWGAYDQKGYLVNWGPISGGKNYCPDVGRSCRTITGTYTVYSKKGPECKSSRFPLPRGGAPMPYCMHFQGGFALHASATVPGYNASHGCVRMFSEDALWLNRDFVRVGNTKVSVVP